MLVITSAKIIAQNWQDEIKDVDWFGDDVDFPQGNVTDDNLSDYLVDDLDDPLPQPKVNDPIKNPNQNQYLMQDDRPDYMTEIPIGNELLGIPETAREIEYSTPHNLIDDGMEFSEVISFEYTNRHGEYAGLRTVEPHYTFIAYTTGNEILVTFDRDVGDIRAFIVGNIHPGGVRYEDVKFQPKPEIMVGVY